ncbi:hypothetical protein TanjilG_23895 [Lupinus angustifolius]|uniref:Uncharacterized protein n=1 Tax=Lupinus angustifolius TaxID=3871 RepID=A0A1J7GM45_LUPAN|nr:PREDICTED: uncharacterized protein LOC109361350 [Lupinus angustifolius]OIW01584.1 hypothetical protein TanjilG_23895 [Lupinus angustifolius]
MVISLGPSKFYGKSLPRPRFYTDVKFNDHRVDPPLPVTDPFMSWAEEAHWSMGGLSFKRLRLQGKIEGNADKLRSQLEVFSKAHTHTQSPSPPIRSVLTRSERYASDSPSPPDAPFAVKRRRFLSPIEKGEAVMTRSLQRKRLVKKLGEEFDLVASENEESVRVGSKLDLDNVSGDGFESDLVGLKRRRRLMKGGEAVGKVVEEDVKKKLNRREKKSYVEKNASSDSGNGVRSSPRLAKFMNN